MTTPEHVDWIEDSGKSIFTSDGLEVEIWNLNYENDEAILSGWAKHFREHYCNDNDLPALIAGTGLSKSQYLTDIKFPDATHAPGPSTRAGDFGEILLADFIEYILGYWCPRQVRYEDRFNRNVSTNGSDVLGFKFAKSDPGDPLDELFLLESKAGFTPTKQNRLQQAIDGSVKDMTREAMSLNAIKQRLLRKSRSDALRVQRFQQEVDRPFKRISGAAIVLENSVFDTMNLTASDASQHPNKANLPLDESRIREVSRKVVGRDRKTPRDQALEEGSDTFREIDEDFQRKLAELAAGELTPESMMEYLHLGLHQSLAAKVHTAPPRYIDMAARIRRGMLGGRAAPAGKQESREPKGPPRLPGPAEVAGLTGRSGE